MTFDTSPRSVSPLRARMIEDMTVRGFNEHTRSGYVRHVRAFAAFIGRSPDMATAEDLRLFQLHQTRSGVQPPSINSAVSALRFFFTVRLDRPDLARRLTVVPALSRQRRRYASRAKTGQASCGCDSALPLRGSIGSEFSQRGSGDEMALKIEGIVDGGMHTQEALRGARRLESLHLALSPSQRLMRVLGSIVVPDPLFVRAPQP